MAFRARTYRTAAIGSGIYPKQERRLAYDATHCALGCRCRNRVKSIETLARLLILD